MSSYQPRDNSGTLWKNDRREKETHPHAKGDCIIDGVEYWVSAWTKEGKKGRFQSLSFERKKTPGQKPKDEAWRARQDDDSDVPF